ncbi:MAG: carbohydrate ABC transporter permease [Treponema sp.]
MVEKRITKGFYFTAFILPCMLLYGIFCIVPFVRGIGISLTNWDGLTPKTPIVLEKSEFEERILSKIKTERDKTFVMSIYSFSAADGTYRRLSVSGLKKIKLERIIKSTGYEPEYNRFVGLANYKQIFAGQVGTDFYPHKTKIEKFTKTSALPRSIAKVDFENEVLKEAAAHADWTAKLQDAYEYDAEKRSYRRTESYDEKKAVRTVLNLAEIQEAGSEGEAAVDDFTRGLEASFAEGKSAFDEAAAEFSSARGLSPASSAALSKAAAALYSIYELKNILASSWTLTEFNMGVVGFTLFFAVFSVIGINTLAFVLAMALDTGIRGQKALRTIFFLPNMLSMIIVALIWSMLFNQLLPALTGIDKWISDSHKTPWLLVLVSVWQGAGYYMIVYLAGLQNIPTEVVEAARIDGATGWQRFRFITLPLMVPSMTISLFLTIANALKSFDLIYAMIGRAGYATGTVPFVMDIYFDAFSKKLAGLATAKAMVLFVVIVLITGVQLFIMKRKEVEA